jgi:hypothetical protein
MFQLPEISRVAISELDVANTLRTYNSHQARVQVITFADLIDGAERVFTLADAGTLEIDASEVDPTQDDPWDDEPPF